MPRFLLLFFFLIFSFSANAERKQIGTACKGDASSADWDALAQCDGSTFLKAPLALGQVAAPPYANTACDAAKAGTIQWTGSAFQGCDGTQWRSIGGTANQTVAVTQIFDNEPPRTGNGAIWFVTRNFTTNGGAALLFVSGSGWRDSANNALIGFSVTVDGTLLGYIKTYTNEVGSHKAFVSRVFSLPALEAGTHTLALASWNGTYGDSADFLAVTLVEFSP